MRKNNKKTNFNSRLQNRFLRFKKLYVFLMKRQKTKVLSLDNKNKQNISVVDCPLQIIRM